MNKKDRFEVLFEDINGKFDSISEGLVALQDVPQRLDRIENRLNSMEATLKIVAPTVKDHSVRITRLEDHVFKA